MSSNNTTYKAALKESTEYFNGDELAAKVFLDKYALRDEDGKILESTPTQMHTRMAKEFARIEKEKYGDDAMTEEEIFNCMDRFKYIVPQGSIMYGLGNKYQYVSLGNCWVVRSPDDSFASILYTDSEIVHALRRRGGIGVCVSNLRPEGTPTRNAARTSSGAVSFLNRYSDSIRNVCINGRRGAGLGCISVHHPDIISFIRCKEETTKLTGMNISVQFSDEFFKALKENRQYELRWPIESETPTISKMIDAKEVWEEFIKHARNYAEPGALFWDTILRESPSDYYDKYGFRSHSVNPCLPGWAVVLTKEGIRRIKEISIGDKIWSKEGWTTVTNLQKNGVQEVYKYSTTACVFYGTKNHKVVVNDSNDKVEIQYASKINMIEGPEPTNVKINIQDVMDGLVIGDGSIHKTSNNLIGLYIGENDEDYFNDRVSELIGKKREDISKGFYEVKTTIEPKELDRTYNRSIPERFIRGNIDTKCSILRGIYSANGSVCGNRITLKSASKNIIEQVQLMLSSIGIKSYYTTSKSNSVKPNNEKYVCKKSYDLNIDTDREKFIKYVGFIQKYKNDKITIKKTAKRTENYDIKSIEYIDTEPVYDITVDNNTHTYWTQGCNVSNCGEQNLSENDSCRLLLLNSFSFVDSPFTKNATFNWHKFYKYAKLAQRMMDNIVDLELEYIQKIINKVNNDPEPEHVKKIELDFWKKAYNKCEEGRRTGTGITAIGDVLAALNLKYDSDEGIQIIERIYRTLKFACYEQSIEMAEKFGPFKVFDTEVEKDCPFFHRIENEEVDLGDRKVSGKEMMEKMKKVGRRNIALLTTAPAGSVSLLTQTTSGIEPLFMLSSIRRKKGNPNDEDFRTDFIDESGDHWMEFDVFHPKLKLWMEITGEEDISKSPYAGSCAEELDYMKRVKLQSEAQKSIDASISSTINVPEDISIEKVKEIYEKAYELGCKGITCYRKNCRSGVLLEKTLDKREKDAIIEKRPRILPCEVYHTSIRGQEYFVLVGIKDGAPYEVFAGRNGFIPRKVKAGQITRKRKDFYKATFADCDVEISPVTASCNEMEEIITRLTSLSLRSGADMHKIVQQLEKVGERQELNSFARGIARILKKYIPDGTDEGEKCPQCGAEGLIRQEGCVLCKGCSWSKCL